MTSKKIAFECPMSGNVAPEIQCLAQALLAACLQSIPREMFGNAFPYLSTIHSQNIRHIINALRPQGIDINFLQNWVVVQIHLYDGDNKNS